MNHIKPMETHRACTGFMHVVKVFCGNWHFVKFGAPYSFWVQHHCEKIKIPVVKQFVRCNAGADYKLNSWHQNNVMCWKLVCWSEHVCNAVILPSHWSYIEQKQETETQFSLLHHTVPSAWLWSSCYNVKRLCWFRNLWKVIPIRESAVVLTCLNVLPNLFLTPQLLYSQKSRLKSSPWSC